MPSNAASGPVPAVGVAPSARVHAAKSPPGLAIGQLLADSKSQDKSSATMLGAGVGPGETLGCGVGKNVPVGTGVGFADAVGPGEGMEVGAAVGLPVVGAGDGCGEEGPGDGWAVGGKVGATEGPGDGAGTGARVGNSDTVGAGVGGSTTRRSSIATSERNEVPVVATKRRFVTSGANGTRSETCHASPWLPARDQISSQEPPPSTVAATLKLPMPEPHMWYANDKTIPWPMRPKVGVVKPNCTPGKFNVASTKM